MNISSIYGYSFINYNQIKIVFDKNSVITYFSMNTQ